MAFWDRNNNSSGLRVIKTARDKDSINRAAKKGLRPLIRKVEPSAEIRSKYSVIQNKITGEIEIIGDYRMGSGDNEKFETVIEWTYHYPHTFKSPFAAYLIPKDIKIGEELFLDYNRSIVCGKCEAESDFYDLCFKKTKKCNFCGNMRLKLMNMM